MCIIQNETRESLSATVQLQANEKNTGSRKKASNEVSFSSSHEIVMNR